MPFDVEKLPSSQLPVSAPDLVVAVDPGGGLRILRLSPRLSRLTGRVPFDAAGKLSLLFPEAVPSLVDLAREVAERGAPLGSIPVRLGGSDKTLLLADVDPGGLTPDYRGQIVSFTFYAPSATASTAGAHGLIGSGPALREVLRKIALYAPTAAPVVITGETGTGKELVARALHDSGPRSSAPYVAVNCSAISDELLESELFGHEKGAFTGAVSSHRGRFERADGGTLFLDEIGDMPLHTQSKLLRVLETGVLERVGAEKEIRVDVRIVAATNVPLEEAVATQHFRADLYHRLSVLRIHLPPLRQRLEDLPLLVTHFLARFNDRYGRTVERLTPEALNLLSSYLWPGNIRELRNVLERVCVESAGSVIGARAFSEWIRERQDFTPGNWSLQSPPRPGRPLAPPYPLASDQRLLTAGSSDTLEAEILPRELRLSPPAELGLDAIRGAYRDAEGNLSAAARRLGVHRATLYRALARLGLDREQLEE
jgi:DNA-binding NtrC family response regulator